MSWRGQVSTIAPSTIMVYTSFAVAAVIATFGTLSIGSVAVTSTSFVSSRVIVRTACFLLC